MGLFEKYLETNRTYAKSISKWVTLSIVFHGLLLIGVALYPVINIAAVPPPAFVVGVFEAAPPPPPPPPPPPAGAEKPKVEKKVEKKKKKVLQEVTKVPEEVKKQEGPADPAGVEGGVKGGVAGGVVGGTVGGTKGGLPGKMLFKAQKRISGEDPKFPAAARALGVTAKVAARVCISASGKVTDIKILKGVDRFNQAVEKAVRGWRYEPYMANGVSVPSCFPVYFNFNLKK